MASKDGRLKIVTKSNKENVKPEKKTNRLDKLCKWSNESMIRAKKAVKEGSW